MTYPGPQYPSDHLSADPFVQQRYRGPQMPSANGGWAAATLICFWPLAFVAFSQAFDVQNLWLQGRYAEAQSASDTVRRLGKISIGILCVILLAYVGLIATLAGLDAPATPETNWPLR